MRLLFIVNSSDFFVSHRLPVAVAAREAGFNVHVASPKGRGVAAIVNCGLTHHVVELERKGTNPVKEIWAILGVLRLFRDLTPDVVHLVTIKPVLYGGIAARMARVNSVVAAISGLGSVFIADGGKARGMRRVVQAMYRQALRHKNLRVIFQNADDRREVSRVAALRPEQSVLIRGSGVKLSDFPVRPEPDGIPVVTMIARLLRDKGVCEFVEAARCLRARGVSARFWLIGEPDAGNPASVTEADLSEWRRQGIVELHGYRSDISTVLCESHVVVLPSYREGLPKALIEAAAAGRPVVTTDVPGCRDAIEPGVTGLLVPPRDGVALGDAIEYLLSSPEIRRAMGRAGRHLAEREFDVEKVIESHLSIYRELRHSGAA